MDSAFLTNLTEKLNNLNLELQGKEKHMMNMISSLNTFKSKLHLQSSRLQQCDLRNFPHMDTELKRQGKDCAELESARYDDQVQSILTQNKNQNKKQHWSIH